MKVFRLQNICSILTDSNTKFSYLPEFRYRNSPPNTQKRIKGCDSNKYINWAEAMAVSWSIVVMHNKATSWKYVFFARNSEFYRRFITVEVQKELFRWSIQIFIRQNPFVMRYQFGETTKYKFLLDADIFIAGYCGIFREYSRFMEEFLEEVLAFIYLFDW